MRFSPSDDIQPGSDCWKECELQRDRVLLKQIEKLKAIDTSDFQEIQIDICQEIRVTYEQLRYEGRLSNQYGLQSINDLLEQADKLNAIIATSNPKLQIAVCQEIRETYREINILLEFFFN